MREILNSTDGDGQDAKRFAEASREAQEEQEMSPGMRAMMSAFESLAEESKEEPSHATRIAAGAAQLAPR